VMMSEFEWFTILGVKWGFFNPESVVVPLGDVHVQGEGLFCRWGEGDPRAEVE